MTKNRPFYPHFSPTKMGLLYTRHYKTVINSLLCRLMTLDYTYLYHYDIIIMTLVYKVFMTLTL